MERYIVTMNSKDDVLYHGTIRADDIKLAIQLLAHNTKLDKIEKLTICKYREGEEQ